MLSKFENFNNFLKKDLLQCPICSNPFLVDENFLKCTNGHTFDISKHGYVTLLNHQLKTDTHYSSDLFSSRRNIINSGFYKKIEDKICEVVNSKNLSDINILDMGSGEGSIAKHIFDNLNCNATFLLLDYSKNAIQSSTTYVNENFGSVVGDINFLPIKDNSIDIVLNFLSPINPKEVKRVLKDNGLIIKIIPTENYLKEYREITNKVYDNLTYLNITKNFEILDEFTISDTFSIPELMGDVFAMTPLTMDVNEPIIVDKITIELKLLVMKIKD